MVSMILFGLRVNQNVVNEDNHKLVQIIHENLVHEIHKISRGVGQSKRHHGILIMTIPCPKSGLGNIRLSYFQLVVTSAEIDLRENTGSTHLVKQVFYLGRGYLFFMVTSLSFR
jgi:hypothetical protein